jgi:exopolysaccharide biosynthesis polyprenyl glycosylphosphotransferase
VTTRPRARPAGAPYPEHPRRAAGGPSRPLDRRTLEILRRHKRERALRRARRVGKLLAVADCAGLVIAFAITRAVYPQQLLVGAYSGVAEILLFAATLPLWVVVARLYGLYDRDAQAADHTTADEAPALLNMLSLGAWLLYLLPRLTGVTRLPFEQVALFWALSVCAVLCCRALARCLARRRVTYVQNAVVLGAGDVGQLVARKLLQHPEYGINLVGFVDDRPRVPREDLDRFCLLGAISELPEIVQRYDVERVIVAYSNDPHEATLQAVRGLADQGVQVDVVPRLFEVVGAGASVHAVEGLALLSLPPGRLGWSARLLKRAFDLVVATAALVLVAPLLAVTAALVKLDSPGPAFFRQPRIGEAGSPFRIWKFRTMTTDAEERKRDVAHLNKHLAPGGDPRMFKAPDDPRVTRIGRLLRRFSLDEVPQLINVVRGEMSLVGPRPLILAEHRFVTDWAEKRLELRPGMTGLWQVLGRTEIPFDEMVRLDYLYVSTWSLWNDVRLLARTLPAVLGRNGAC